MQSGSHLHLVTGLARRLDAVVCAGSIANAARSVRQDQLRADERRQAQAAFRRIEQVEQRGLLERSAR